MSPGEINYTIADECGRLSPEAQRKESLWPDIAIAKAHNAHCLPDYFRDLNAIHQAEAVLLARSWDKMPSPAGTLPIEVYYGILKTICGGEISAIRATAPQRAEAFVRTVGRWKD